MTDRQKGAGGEREPEGDKERGGGEERERERERERENRPEFKKNKINKNNKRLPVQVGVVITDGRSRHRTNTAAEGRLAMADDIWLLAIGVGRSVDTAELSLFASDPKQDFVLHVPSFRALAAHVPALTSTVCSIRAPLAVDDASRSWFFL